MRGGGPVAFLTPGDDVNDTDKADYIKSLLEERTGCEKRGLTDRVKDIDAELRKVGHEAKTPAKRSESRPAAKKTKETRG